MGRERRAHRRAALHMLVQFRIESLEEFMNKYAGNISAGGMFIHSKTPHSEGSLIYLQFRLESGEKLIEGLGRVVHVNPPGHQEPGMGVEFVNLDPESVALIERIVDERLGSDAGNAV